VRTAAGGEGQAGGASATGRGYGREGIRDLCSSWAELCRVKLQQHIRSRVYLQVKDLLTQY